MSDTIIRVENLGKKYIIGHQKQERYLALRDAIANGAKSAGRKLLKPWGKREPNAADEEFWALKDVSFEIKRGDRVGIIGRNGAGKSTLLKILSRITEPTKGSIRIKGRVASLLEVGTGFHPELTGRENIYLNGAILGMSKAEIKRKFDEIVAFAEVEKFLDTPVKRYSSGMYVRLAFAVAAHLEPEILIVDEVLAVGDTQFQEKCLGKMEDVAKEGRTVLFVSHNMGATRALCKRGILLSKGTILVDDSIGNAIHYYSGYKISYDSSYTAVNKLKQPYFKKIELYQVNKMGNIFAIEEQITIKFDVETYGKKDLVIGIAIRNDQGILVHHSSNEFNYSAFNKLEPQWYCEIPPNALAPGKYYLDVIVAQRNIELFENITDVLAFEVDFGGITPSGTTSADWKGVCGPGILSWH
jgi:lipopolysaccharide transport system ATP-binding protein